MIEKCLAKDPEDRWQTAKDLQDELVWIASEQSRVEEKAVVSGRMKWQMRVAVGLLILVTAASTFLWVTVDKERKKAEVASEEAAKGLAFGVLLPLAFGLEQLAHLRYPPARPEQNGHWT